MSKRKLFLLALAFSVCASTMMWGHPGSVEAKDGAMKSGQGIVTLDPAVKEALKATGASYEELLQWSRDPSSVLRFLHGMKPRGQKELALLAQYIKEQNSRLSAETAWREAAAFVHYCNKYDVPVDLAVAVANAESHFNPKAKSRQGALGVMQVMWRFHRDLMQANGILSPQELCDPEKGIAAGCLLLSRHLREKGSVEGALASYLGIASGAYQRRISRNMSKLANYRKTKS
jgi:soluble lytic murein transglycosylase-like protein